MSTPPDSPYIYPHPPEEPSTTETLPPRRTRRPGIVLVAIAITIIAAMLVIYLRLPASAPAPISARDISATAEAQTFATSQVNRQSTRLAASHTAQSQTYATSTAYIAAAATQQANANKTATAAAQATSQAPPTLTAQAQQFSQAQAGANATTQPMDQFATLVYGPANGSLVHTATKDAQCEAGALETLTNFIAEARFYNPYPAAQHAWDYGFAITNQRDQYVAAIDSDSGRFFSLQAPGYTIQHRDTTSLIDLTEGGSNLIKLYVQDEVAHLYINGQYAGTQIFSDLHFGSPAAPPDQHGLLVCTGLREGNMQPDASTRFEGFTVWSAP